MKHLDTKKIAILAAGGVFSALLLGIAVQMVMKFPEALVTGDMASMMDVGIILDPNTWLFGIVVMLFLIVLYMVFRKNTFKNSKEYMKGSRTDVQIHDSKGTRF